MSEERKKRENKIKAEIQIIFKLVFTVDSIWKQAFVLMKRLLVRSMETAFDHRHVLAFFFSPDTPNTDMYSRALVPSEHLSVRLRKALVPFPTKGNIKQALALLMDSQISPSPVNDNALLNLPLCSRDTLS